MLGMRQVVGAVAADDRLRARVLAGTTGADRFDEMAVGGSPFSFFIAVTPGRGLILDYSTGSFGRSIRVRAAERTGTALGSKGGSILQVLYRKLSAWRSTVSLSHGVGEEPRRSRRP